MPAGRGSGPSSCRQHAKAPAFRDQPVPAEQIARDLLRSSGRTRSARTSAASTPSSVSVTAPRRYSARENSGRERCRPCVVVQPGQPGLDVGGDGFGRLVGVHRDQDAPFGVVLGLKRARRLGEHPEPVPDHVGGVLAAAAALGGRGPAGAASAPPPARTGRPPPRASRRASAASSAAAMACGRFRGKPSRMYPPRAAASVTAGVSTHVEHDDLVGNEITARLMGGNLSAERAPGLGFASAAGLRRRCAARRTRPRAARPACPCRRREERAAAASPSVRPSGVAISRFWILPVAPLGSASMIQTWRGYLYAATWPLT